MSTEQLITQLAKQWFATPHLSATELIAKLATDAEHSEWVLFVDDAEQLTGAQTDWLLQLNVRLFLFASEAQRDMQLNLAIPALTLSDCEQLLKAETLNTLSLAERFARSQGNLHQLLAKEPKLTKRLAINTDKSQQKIAVFVAVFLVLLVGTAIWLHDDVAPEQSELAIINVDVQPPNIVALPMMPSFSEPELATTAEPELASLSADPEQVTVMAEQQQDTLQEALLIAEASVPVSSIEPKISEQPILEQKAKPAIAKEKPKTTAVVTSTQPEAVYDHLTLLEASARALVVQLAVVSGENALKRFKQSYPQLQILVYQRNSQGKEQWIIVSGPFNSNAAARQLIQQLPDSLSASGPFIKTVGAVQQEIQTWQRLKLAKTTQGN